MLKSALIRLLRRIGLAADPGPVWDGTAGASVLLVNRWGIVVDASAGAATMLGLPRGAIVGARLAAFFASDARGEIDRALALGGSAGRARARLALGEARSLALLFSERPDGRRAVLVLAAAEAGLEAAPKAVSSDDAAALKAASEAARREAKETADLLADLSHEMRTPLNAVIGFADAMREETFGPLGHAKYGEYAEHIRASGGHLLDLVSSILDLAKIEADRFALKRETVDVGALAAECAGVMRLQAEAAGLRLVADIAPDLPASFLDKRAVRQILLNLLSNAVKFTSDGEVRLAAKADGGDIVLTVTDTGVGMSEAELNKLGARFTAAQGAGVRGAKGNGLGLALAFALAELHGGSMTLRSAPGEGVRAAVRLPVEAPAKPDRARRRLAAVSAGAAPRAGEAPAVLTQLERIEAYRRERASAA